MEFVNYHRINNLKQLVIKELSGLIDKDYVLIDVPNHRNIGDNLIWKGEIEFLKNIPQKMVYSANMHTYRHCKVPDDKVILLHGGGNFGDIYLDSYELKVDVIKNFPNHRIIIFPQTVHFKDEQLLAEQSKLFNKHRDLVLCARDKVSEQILLKYVIPEKIKLLPDMAFFIDLSNLQDNSIKDRSLYLKRVDKEINNKYTFDTIRDFLSTDRNSSHLEIKDWPTYSMNKFRNNLIAKFDALESKVARKLIDIPVISHLVDSDFGLNPRSNMDRYINMGIHFLNSYDKIATTRLHGLILSILLDKEVGIVDNSYGKNFNFYDTWLKDFDKVTLIKS